jgi:pantoate--beta-alanine ligase
VKLVQTVAEVVRETGAWRKAGERIALVPTMGWFHEGHLSLMRMARSLGSRTIVSLFVNPIQFGPREDLAAYPRDLDRDRRMAENEGVDILFAPSAEEMFEPQFQTRVSLGLISQGLCGADRPGHFDGVATIVAKLFHLASPDVAVFGEKDLQQLALIRRMVKDLNFNVEIVGHPIVREPDGLAMSSRNSYLTETERRTALCLSQAICRAREAVRQSANDLPVEALAADAVAFIAAHAGCQVDYVSIVDRWTLVPCTAIDRDSVIALAVKINGRVRLIDNGLLLQGDGR